MDMEMFSLAAAAGTAACVLSDQLIHAILVHLRWRNGIPDGSKMGAGGRITLSLALNSLFCGLFVYLAATIARRGLDVMLMAGVLWLVVSVPVALSSGSIGESRRGLLAVRIMGWLCKATAVAVLAVCILF